MHINNGAVSLADYGATYLNHVYIPAKPEVSGLWADKSLTPLYFDTVSKYSSLKVQVMFKDAEIENVSTLGEKLQRCIISLDVPFLADKTLDCTLIGIILKKESRTIYTATYAFDCIIYGASHEIIASGNTIYIFGAKETEAVIYIANTTNAVISTAKINDFTVTNLAVGETIIIDGERKTVTSGGVNVFDRVQFSAFPRFNVGENAVTTAGSAAITIMYKERW
ncbi:hypothetical protein FACS1894219_10850 [Clostridia bacterium]|nr:hypothetical protein FACS1894219_10850 [Clostridia bacterium]